MNAPLDISALFGTGLRQHARLLTLASAHDSGLPESLAVEAIRGREAINALFRFNVDALSTLADLDLPQFLGEELTIGLLQPDGSRRGCAGLRGGCGSRPAWPAGGPSPRSVRTGLRRVWTGGPARRVAPLPPPVSE